MRRITLDDDCVIADFANETTVNWETFNLERAVSRPAAELQIEVNVDDGVRLPIEVDRLRDAARAACQYRGCDRGELGIRVTEDQEIHRINRSYLHHDYPTDVISFGYQLEPPHVEGELVVSAETARRVAAEHGWTEAEELLLYVVHGTLHICGLDDLDPQPRMEMRQGERCVMQRLGIADMGAHNVDGRSEHATSSGPSAASEEPA